ncbi:hypothetical protein VE03_05158 [Pseudogymnoascus sp. 23342-1-I1]|nr:hypothetical protein VE03_05158 [Pseudogymnoascus sp. 23342-1-I1]
MGQDVSNPIRNFQYDLSSEDHSRCLQAAAEVGMIPKTPNIESYFSFDGPVRYSSIKTFLHDEKFQIYSPDPADDMQREFVFYGLRIGLFPSTFLDHLEYGLEDGEICFPREDFNSVELLLQGVEQALRGAFDPPSTQIEVPHKKNFSQLMGEETVTVIVGQGEGAKKFVIHKDLLMNKVAFFEKMFNSKFFESSTGTAILPEDSPEAFEVLVEWIYCSTLKTLHGEETDDPYLPDLAISIIGLAEKYMLPELGDRAITYLANVGKELVPTMAQMSTIYEQTPSDSKARKYAARTVAWALVNSEASGVSSTAIQEACQDGDLLLDAITEVRGKNGYNHGRAHTFPICDYHNHAKATKCPYEGGQEQTAKQHKRNRYY